jgi:hypothetical protein
MTDTNGTSPGELGGMIAGALALLGAAGAGLKWLAGWMSGREETRAARNARWEADLDQREREMENKLSASLARCEEHCAAIEAKFEKMRIAILLVLPELQRVAPYSPALKHARDLLRDTFPIPIDLPGDMAGMMDEVERITV